MYYGDKQQAKVMIHNELIKRGWKTYGFDEDQSDSMTDYFHPASWNGIAEKNGYVLVIDQHNTYYSGYEIKKYDYSKMKANNNNNSKIEKLRTLANDEGATEGEKAAALAGIERLSGKTSDTKPTYTVSETYPVFTSGNPGKCSWHIEKDGQILAKGTGVFAVNDYDWENKEKTAEQQKQEKLLSLVDRFEKVLKDADALESEVIQVPKQVIKPVEIEKSSIAATEVNDNTYFVMKVNYTNGNYKGTMYKCERASTAENAESFIFARLGKNLKPSKARGKTWYLAIARINELLSKGHIAIVEMQEFTEYEEKTVFKKTARKQQKANFDNAALVGDVAEEKEAETVHNSSNTVAQATFEVNEKLNGIEITFPGKPAQAVIDKLKENGFRWHKVKKLWYAVKTSERLRLAESICNAQVQPQNVAETEEEVQHVAECLQSISADVLINNGFRIWETPLTDEQNELYKKHVKAEIERCKYNVTQAVINKLKAEPAYQILANALESFSGSHSTNKKQEKEPSQSDYIPKIDKQIESNQKKLDSLSVNYLTNTWKRQQEEVSRDNKREALRQDIALLEYLKDKAEHNNMTALEQALTIGSVREDMKTYCKQKYSYNHEIRFPVVESHLPKDGWWNIEAPKKQKRLQKANIYNTNQLITAIEEYHGIVSEIEQPVNPVTQKIKKLEMEVKLRKIDGYFPTPETIVQHMIELADITDGNIVLEPSAGNGNILDGITTYLNNNGITADLDGIEWNHTLRDILELKNYKLVADDFLEYDKYNHYDKIIMNPPFERLQDQEHVKHAYECLKPGGRIVAIMSPHFTFANDSKSVSFREWLDRIGYYEKLPDGSFKDSGTGVNTVLVVIDKPEAVKPHNEIQPRFWAYMLHHGIKNKDEVRNHEYIAWINQQCDTFKKTKNIHHLSERHHDEFTEWLLSTAPIDKAV